MKKKKMQSKIYICAVIKAIKSHDGNIYMARVP